MRVGGAHQGVDREWLAADFRRDPACDHRNEASRSHQYRGAVQPFEKLSPEASEQSSEAKAERRKRQSDRDPE
jgi:hypothetical protein